MHSDELLEILKDKSKLMKLLLEVLAETQKSQHMLDESRYKINEDTSVDALKSHLRNTILALSKTQVNLYNIATITLIYAQSSSFDTDVAMYLNKIGLGREAISTMFKNKMKGK